ncbi:hypothetical protein HPB48_015078 [Haemaphysalis longicornis]|uniref:THAP-type domain-containing protein n=1 Tax=Haemaphysalis longicornis TaxID=44386 RepID=A0A9J6GHM1_HAELO|nr:hypothetical protein HPB48_015078 [Haemaphysalis longicornis]
MGDPAQLPRLGPCCVVPGCSKRSGANLLSAIRSFRFPKDPSRRAAWVQAVRRDKWLPNDRSVICSTHFITGCPSQDPTHPDYVPSIFPFKAPKHVAKKVARHGRLQERLKRQNKHAQSKDRAIATKESECSHEELPCAEESATADSGTNTEVTGSQLETLLQENESLKKEVCDLKKELTKTTETLRGFKACNENLQRSLESNTPTKDALRDDLRVKFYTGLVSRNMFYSLLSFVLSFWKPDTQTFLEPEEQLVMVLMRLRLGLLTEDLACRFRIPSSSVSVIFHRWLDILSSSLGKLLIWPSRKAIRRNLPDVFCDPVFKNVRCTVDCSEIFIHKPSFMSARSQTFSQYKHHNTAKFLVAVSPAGAITFISKAWGGRVSDKELTAKCGLLDKIDEGDVILADRGFKCEELLAAKGASVLMPSFTKGKKQLSGKEVALSRKLSRARIHVERTIQRLKTFRIFQMILPISYVKKAGDVGLSTIDKTLIVCSALLNLQTPVIAGVGQNG